MSLDTALWHVLAIDPSLAPWADLLRQAEKPRVISVHSHAGWLQLVQRLEEVGYPSLSVGAGGHYATVR